MAHKKFQKVELDQQERSQSPVRRSRLGDSRATSRQQETQRPAMKYGERVEIVNVPYSDSPNYYRSLNVTCNPVELQLSLRKQREDVAKAIAQHEEYQRVPKGARVLKRKLKLDKADTADTRRINH